MGVAGRRFNVAVPEQLPDHRQGLAERQCAGREGVTQVMNSNIVKTGPGADAPPRLLEIGEMRAEGFADDDSRVVVRTRKGKKHTDPNNAGGEAGRAVIEGATSRPPALLRGDREG